MIFFTPPYSIHQRDNARHESFQRSKAGVVLNLRVDAVSHRILWDLYCTEHHLQNTKDSEPVVRKRARSLSSQRSSPSPPPKAQKTANAGRQPRPKAADYNDVTKAVIARGVALYRVRLATVQPYPDHATETATVREVLKEACAQTGFHVTGTPDLFKIVRAAMHRCTLIR